MRITVLTADEERDVELDAAPRSTTLRAVLDALGLGLGDPVEVRVDGRGTSPEVTIVDSGLGDGSVLEVVTTSRTHPPDEPPVIELHQIGGLDAGSSLPLPAGRFDMGPAERHDSVVMRRADAVRLDLDVVPDGDCVVTPLGGGEVTLDGLALAGPTRLGDGALHLAARVFRVSPALDRRRPVRPPRRDGPVHERRVHHRPPRVMPSDEPLPPLAVPVRPLPPARLPRLLVVAVLPVLAGLVAGLVVDPWLFLVAALGPLVLLGWLIERRVRGERSRRRYALEVHRLATGFAVDLDFHRSTAIRRARAAVPDLAELRARAQRLDPTVWERRSSHPDFGHVALGFAMRRWLPVTTAPVEAFPELLAIRDAGAVLPLVPVVVDLAATGSVGLVGPRDDVLAVARSVLVQLAVLHGPADLALVLRVDPQRVAEWDWCKWLPHAVEPTAVPRVALDDTALTALLARAGARRAVRPVLVVDADVPVHDDNHPVHRAIAAGAIVVVLAPSASRLPRDCSLVLAIDDAGAGRLSQPGDVVDGAVLPTGVGEHLAREVARNLASLDDDQAPGPPVHVSESTRVQVRPFVLGAGSVGLPRRVGARRADP